MHAGMLGGEGGEELSFRHLLEVIYMGQLRTLMCRTPSSGEGNGTVEDNDRKDSVKSLEFLQSGKLQP